MALGNPAAALTYVDRADAVVTRLGPAAQARAGTATLLRAEVLLHAGEPVEAQAYARRAVDEFSLIDKPFFLGRAHLVLGRALAASGQRAASLAELTTAQTIFTEIGADQLATVSVQAQRQLGKRAVRGPASVGGLTQREAEVAALVAKGHTNRMIAQQLSLSERTVETHIRHICTRLDVSSRTAIAVAITRGERARMAE